MEWIPDEALDQYMRIAIREAEESLREGNHGFGAVILKGAAVIARTHDTEETDRDPTAHAELKAIRAASSLLGKDLSACLLIATHEPCPMCAGAVVWSRLQRVAYGYGIEEALAQRRSRIAISCEELFTRAQAAVQVQKGVLQSACSVLYDRRVRAEINKLRRASDRDLLDYDRTSAEKRMQWYAATHLPAARIGAEPLESAYALLLQKLDLRPEDAPIVHRDAHRIVFHSRNFCPTLEACKILGLDTRRICRLFNEGATQALIRQIDPQLSFRRNYVKIRPYTEYCEEMIEYGV